MVNKSLDSFTIRGNTNCIVKEILMSSNAISNEEFETGAQIWSRRVCATALCIAGLVGSAFQVDGSGWLIFFGGVMIWNASL